jgi:hypothetical protein
MKYTSRNIIIQICPKSKILPSDNHSLDLDAFGDTPLVLESQPKEIEGATEVTLGSPSPLPLGSHLCLGLCNLK